jgi:hypothetical protein
MGLSDIDKCKQELFKYVNDNKKDYEKVFKLYDEKKSTSLFKKFIDFCSKINKCDDSSLAGMCDLINQQKDLFYTISKNKNLSKHHKVCVLSVNVYLTFLSKSCKSQSNVCMIDDKNKSKNSASSSSDSNTFKQEKVCKMNTSSDDKVNNNSSDEICKKPSKTQCSSSSSSSSSSTDENGCEPCQNICKEDDEYPFDNAANEGCCINGGCNDCTTSGCDDIEQIEKVTQKLKSVSKNICMLNSILSEMQKEFVNKMNLFGVSDAECYLNCVDIDFENKLMYVLYKQIDALVTQNNCVFNGTKDTQQIKVYLNCGQSMPICIIDNIKFTFVNECNKKYILVNVGSRQYKLWFLSDCITNEAAICLLKQNCCTIRLILYALASNQKMITHWLNVSKNMLKCKELCKDNKCESKCDC